MRTHEQQGYMYSVVYVYALNFSTVSNTVHTSFNIDCLVYYVVFYVRLLGVYRNSKLHHTRSCTVFVWILQIQ